MNFKQSKLAALSGGLTYVDMNEIDINSRFNNKLVFFIDVLGDSSILLKSAFEREDADVEVLKSWELMEELAKSNKTVDIFINIVNVNWDNYSSILQLEEPFNKQLFFVCQAEKEYLIDKNPKGKILNIANVDIENNSLARIAYNGIERLTRGLAKSVAPYGITTNTLITNSIEASQLFLTETSMFFTSDYSNDIIGQIIRVK